MRDEAQLRRFIESTSLLGQLARVFAPRPKIYVFTEMTEIALDTQRDPYTHQRLVGMSAGLFRRLANKLLDEQNVKIEDRAEIMLVQGRMFELAWPARPAFADWYPADVAPKAPELIRVLLDPKPVTL